MTDAVAIQITISTAAVLVAGVSAYFSYKAKTSALNTHELVNSRMSQLLKMAKSSSRAAGRLEGGADQRRKDNKIDQKPKHR